MMDSVNTRNIFRRMMREYRWARNMGMTQTAAEIKAEARRYYQLAVRK